MRKLGRILDSLGHEEFKRVFVYIYTLFPVIFYQPQKKKKGAPPTRQTAVVLCIQWYFVVNLLLTF